MSQSLIAIALLMLGLAQLGVVVWFGLLVRVSLEQVHARLFALEVEWKKLNEFDSGQASGGA